jgi:hypothetical protein
MSISLVSFIDAGDNQIYVQAAQVQYLFAETPELTRICFAGEQAVTVKLPIQAVAHSLSLRSN